jgi:hypothetical protein
MEGLKEMPQQEIQCKEGEYGRAENMPFKDESVRKI